jgi:hypothetical protein
VGWVGPVACRSGPGKQVAAILPLHRIPAAQWLHGDGCVVLAGLGAAGKAGARRVLGRGRHHLALDRGAAPRTAAADTAARASPPTAPWSRLSLDLAVTPINA